MMLLAGQPDPLSSLPFLGSMLGAATLLVAAAVLGTALRRSPGVPWLSAGLAVAALFPLVIWAPEVVPMGYTAHWLVLYALIFLELVVGISIVATVVVRRQSGWTDDALPDEDEESHA